MHLPIFFLEKDSFYLRDVGARSEIALRDGKVARGSETDVARRRNRTALIAGKTRAPRRESTKVRAREGSWRTAEINRAFGSR